MPRLFLTAGFLGMMYYFIPKQAGRRCTAIAVHRALLGTDLLHVGGSTTCTTPALPDWTQSVGMAFAGLLAPAGAGMINGIMTLSVAWHKLRDDPILRFLIVSLSFYGMSTKADDVHQDRQRSHYHRLDGGPRALERLGWVGLITMGSFLPWFRACLARKNAHSVKAIESALLAAAHHRHRSLIAAMWIAGVFRPDVAAWSIPMAPDLYLRGGEGDPIRFYVIRVMGGVLYLTVCLIMAWNTMGYRHFRSFRWP